MSELPELGISNRDDWTVFVIGDDDTDLLIMTDFRHGKTHNLMLGPEFTRYARDRGVWISNRQFESKGETHYTTTEKKAVAQFNQMLFTSSGALRPTGYLALRRLRKQLRRHSIKEFTKICGFADTLSETHQSRQISRELVEYALSDTDADLQLDLPDHEPLDRWELREQIEQKITVSEDDGIFIVLHLLGRGLINYLETDWRAVAAANVITSFELRGEPYEVGRADEDKTAANDLLRVQLGAIAKVLENDKVARGIKSNAELYREADKRGKFGYSEPESSFRKAMAKHIPRQYGCAVPETPAEWKSFLDSLLNGKKERG